MSMLQLLMLIKLISKLLITNKLLIPYPQFPNVALMTFDFRCL